jgi:acetyl esterase
MTTSLFLFLFIIVLSIIAITYICVVCKSKKSNKGQNRPHHMLSKPVQNFIDNLPTGPPLYKLKPQDARKVLIDLQTTYANSPSILHAQSKTTIQDIMLSNTNIGIRIVRPAKILSHNPLPFVLYCHGGGWVLGNEYTHDNLIRQLSFQANVAVVFIKYTLAPEAQYPTAINQAYQVMQHLMTHGSWYNLDSNRFSIAGDSVGGNMATCLTILAVANNFPVQSQLLFYPVTGSDFSTPSYLKYENGPWLTKAAMKWFWDNYCPNTNKRAEYFASPLETPINILKTMPKTLIILDENDVLKCEGVAYYNKLKDSKVDVTMTIYNGTIHDFMMLNGLAETEQTQHAIKQASDFVKHTI